MHSSHLCTKCGRRPLRCYPMLRKIHLGDDNLCDELVATRKRICLRKPGTECIYGILKKRFRILAEGCHLKSTEDIDDVFRFLVSLHNRVASA